MVFKPLDHKTQWFLSFNKGAVGESLYVYIGQNTNYYIKTNSSWIQLKVFGVEFGTELNALLAINWTQKNAYLIDYDSIEPHPLTWSHLHPITIEKLVFKSDKDPSMWMGDPPSLAEVFKLTKFSAFLEKFKNKCSYYDVNFFDAFSPSKQQYLASIKFRKYYTPLKKNSFLFTYYAQGQFNSNWVKNRNIVRGNGEMGKWEMFRDQKVT